MDKTTKTRRVLQGEVVSDKMDNTIVVAVKTRKMHSLYKKYINRTKKIMAHDAKQEASIGDIVKVVETRPLSRKKRWILQVVLQRKQ